MDSEDFRKWSHRAADWGADYRGTIRDLPVRPRVEPGEIAALIAASAPEDPEPMEKIFADFQRAIVPGMTHWQHPRFFAYFPGNAAPVSVVAEYLISAMAASRGKMPLMAKKAVCMIVFMRPPMPVFSATS